MLTWEQGKQRTQKAGSPEASSAEKRPPILTELANHYQINEAGHILSHPKLLCHFGRVSQPLLKCPISPVPEQQPKKLDVDRFKIVMIMIGCSGESAG